MVRRLSNDAPAQAFGRSQRIRVMTSRVLLIGLLSLFANFALLAQEPRDSAVLAVDCKGRPTSLVDTTATTFASDDKAAPQPHKPLVPRYPPDLRRAKIVGRVVTNYTVDTIGRVVPSSIAILFASQPQFRASVCDALLAATYPPLRQAGARHQFRIVQSVFDFNIQIIRRPRF